MHDLEGLEFEWLAGRDVSDKQLRECSELYSAHYGVYGDGHARSGQPVRLGADRMRLLVGGDDSCAALAYLRGQLVGYAFLVRGLLPRGGIVSWVTQLVVHSDYRERKAATRLFRAAWGLSDHIGWGLATANPYAVRALETATRRRCSPQVISGQLDDLRAFGASRINYIRDKIYYVDHERSVVNTEFFVSHANLGKMMEKSSGDDKTWTLGNLNPGEEWLAFTFRKQAPRPLTREELGQMLADHDGIVKEAYARMSLNGSHKWTQETGSEVDFVVASLCLDAGHLVLDAGCGMGRHALELAKKGYRVVGVDFIPEYIERATRYAEQAGLSRRVRFVCADCRNFDLGEKFDGAICLYDVIGSFPHNEDNQAVLGNVAKHVKPGRRLLLSVLNRGIVEAQAQYKGDIFSNLDCFLDMPPSNAMQTNGEIFNPDCYFFDPNTSLVYRKEQFIGDKRLPSELIVRDRRYSADELKKMCLAASVRPIWTRHVRTGHWEENYGDAHHPRAKEILLLGERQ